MQETTSPGRFIDIVIFKNVVKISAIVRIVCVVERLFFVFKVLSSSESLYILCRVVVIFAMSLFSLYSCFPRRVPVFLVVLAAFLVVFSLCLSSDIRVKSLSRLLC